MATEIDNKGFKIIGHRPEGIVQKPRTAVVLGVGRGGTSAVAGMLHHLGLFMGTGARAPTFEGTHLAKAIRRDDTATARQIIRDYTEQHTIWGFKHGSLFHRAQQFNQLLDNPLYLIVFRDLAAIANRAELSTRGDFLQVLQQQYELYGRIIQFIKETRPHALIVSYEKLLLNARPIVEAAADFCGIEPSTEQLEAAVNFVEPSPLHYLKTTRTFGAIGNLSACADGKIIGWARPKPSNGDHELTVELLINGEVVDSTIANQYREGLEKIKANGRCGFEFNRNALRVGDEIRARVAGDEFDLHNSPLRVAEAEAEADG